MNLHADRQLTQLPQPATFPHIDRGELTKRQNKIVNKAEEDVLAEVLTITKGAAAAQGVGHLHDFTDATNQVTIARMGRRNAVNRRLCPSKDLQALMIVASVEGAGRMVDAQNAILEATNNAVINIVGRELSLPEEQTLLQRLQGIFAPKR